METSVITTITTQIMMDQELDLSAKHESMIAHPDNILPPAAIYAAVIGACRSTMDGIPSEFRIETDLLMRFELISQQECENYPGTESWGDCITGMGQFKEIFEDEACFRCRVRKIIDDWSEEGTPNGG